MDPGWCDHDRLLQLIVPRAGDTRGGESWWLEVAGGGVMGTLWMLLLV